MSSPPSTGPTPGPFSTLDVRRVAAGGVGPSIMGFWGGGGMDSSSELFLECSVTSVISLFGLVTLLIFFANMTVGTRDAVVAKIQELSDGPSEVTLSDEKWERVQPCLLPKKGGFGSNQGPASGETQVQQRRRRQAHRRRGAEDSLFDPEGIIKHSGHWSPDPTGGQGGNDKVGPRPLNGMQLTDTLKNLPDLVESIKHTNLWICGQFWSLRPIHWPIGLLSMVLRI